MNQTMNLMEKVAAPDNLLAAWRAVRGNIPVYRRQRSAGPDGVTLAEYERDLTTQLSSLRHLLLKGRYQPQQPGLISIQKPNGGKRQIAILNVSDRIAQRAAQQVLEPLYEPTFLPCSFGFRPGRSIQDAVYCARRMRGHGYGWVVDGDIASCFDSLDHRLLLQRIGKHIGDSRLMDLLTQWLNLGVLENGIPAEHENWLVQGWKKAQNGVRKGVDWTLTTLGQQRWEDPAQDPWNQPGVPQPGFGLDPEQEGFIDADYQPVDADPYQPGNYPDAEGTSMRRRALQQIGSGGLLLGLGWARRGLAKAVPTAAAALKTPAGRAILKQGLMVGGGTLGAVAGVAVAAYLVYRQVGPSAAGILQGSPLSPLLANIYLHAFDHALTRGGYRMVRYADDWVILCPDEHSAEKAYNQSILALSQIHLKVNPEKTHILSPADPLEWLGEVID